MTGTIAFGARVAAPGANAWQYRSEFRSSKSAAEGEKQGKQGYRISHDDKHAAVMGSKGWSMCCERLREVLVVGGEFSDADGEMRRLRLAEYRCYSTG